MPIKRVVEYDGFDLTADGMHAGIAADDVFGTWRVAVDERSRPGAHPAIGAVAMSARRIAVDLTFPNGASAATINTAFQTLMGGLQPDKPHDPENPRYLVAHLADGSDTPVRRAAVIEGPLEATLSGGVNGFRVVFVSADPAWRLVTPVASSPLSVAGNNTTTFSSVSRNNGGHARAYPYLSFDVTGREATGFARWRRTVELTNGLDRPMVGEAVEVDLGDTSVWSNTNAFDGDWNVWVYRDGAQVPRELVNFNEDRSTMWVHVDHLAAGASATLEIVYGGSDGPTLRRLTGRRRPAFDIGWQLVETAAGSTATVINVAGSPGWYADQWAYGALFVVDGALANSGRDITSSTASTITVPALSAAPGTAIKLLLRKSRDVALGSTARRLYNVRQVDRTDDYRGLWYLDDEDNTADIRFDTPGAWEPYRHLDNGDETAQTDFQRINVGDVDSFALLDAHRAGQGVYVFENPGSADGVRHSSVFPLTAWGFDGQLKNPNGVVHAWFGSRPTEAVGWAEVRDVTTIANTLTSFSFAENALPTGTRHLCAALLPANDALIGPEWVGIRASRTGGGTSGTATVTDANLAGVYADDTFNEAKLLVVSGTGAGIRRTVSDYNGTTGQFTVSSNFPSSLDDTSRFEVIQKPLLGNLRTNTAWYLALDLSGLTKGALSAEASNYPVAMIVRVDGPGLPYHRLRIGLDALVAFSWSSGTTVEVDCAGRRAWIDDGAGGEVDVTAAVVPQVLGADGTARLTHEWLPMAPGSHTVEVQQQGAATFSLTASLEYGYLG